MSFQPPDTIAALGAPLAHGRTATLYAWGDHQVVKLFLSQASAGAVHYEADVARRAQATGVTMPAVGEVVTIEGRLGIIYARVDGVTLLQKLNTQPWQALNIMRRLAVLHVALHQRCAPSLPSQRERMINAIKRADCLPAHLRDRALAVLATLPDGDTLCHGDFHPDNVLMTANGPVIIDWVDATHGNPLADVARTLMLFRLAGVTAPPARRWWRQPLLTTLAARYRRQYDRLHPFVQADLRQWLIPVMAARLAEQIPEEQAHILQFLQRS